MRYHAAAIQTSFDCPTDRSEIGQRVQRMCDMIGQTIVGYEPFFDVRLFAFPEFSHAAPIFDDVDKLIDKLAVPIPNEYTDCYQRVAKQFGCYIQTGTFLEIDDRWPGVVFNTTLLIGPGGILSRYRKVNTWVPWEIHASPHDLEGYDEPMFPVVTTEIGRIGAAICYDWLFPEVIRELAVGGADVLIRVSAYMDPWGSQPPMDWWTLFNRTRAAENTCYVVASNQAATFSQYPPFSWPGSSMIVDFDGRVLAQADPGPGEKVVVAPIDIEALKDARQRRRGHSMIAHLRNSAYTYLDKAGFTPAGDDASRLSKSINDSRIQDAMERTGENPAVDRMQ